MNDSAKSDHRPADRQAQRHLAAKSHRPSPTVVGLTRSCRITRAIASKWIFRPHKKDVCNSPKAAEGDIIAKAAFEVLFRSASDWPPGTKRNRDGFLAVIAWPVC